MEVLAVRSIGQLSTSSKSKLSQLVFFFLQVFKWKVDSVHMNNLWRLNQEA